MPWLGGDVSVVEDATYATVPRRAPVAEGRVWLGTDARKNGLVDDLGGLDKALELLRKKAKLGANEKVQLVPYPPRRSFFEQLFGRSADNLLDSQLRRVLPVADLNAWRQGGYLAIMPWQLDIR